ncbi:MAG: corrinoid protein [Candidatus Heimdallarchaeota archaeon]
MNSGDAFQKITQAVIDGQKEEVTQLVKETVDNQVQALDIVNKALVPGIDKVGELWENGDYFLPELIVSAEAMKAGMDLLQPLLEKDKSNAMNKGTVVIGTVEGDIHDIGKTLVGSLLQANGFEVHDLGADVPIDTFLAKAKETNADIIALSALLTTTMVEQKKLIEKLNDKGEAERAKHKVLVGGAPVSPEWTEKIGADGTAPDAMSAVRLAISLLERK